MYANADAGWANRPRTVKKVVVAVIDTGISTKLLNNKSYGTPYCEDGHKDFTGTGLEDNHGHGTHISSIIDQYAKNIIFEQGKQDRDLIDYVKVNYCQIILKYFDTAASNGDNLKNTVKAFKWAVDQKVDIINYSGGGLDFSEEEKDVIEEALNNDIKVVVAAGNEKTILEKDPCLEIKAKNKRLETKARNKCLKGRGEDIKYGMYYPAMYDKRIYIVGNLVDSKTRVIASSSNRGKGVNTWEVGVDVMSRIPDGYGLMTGTSQATAIKTGKLVREMLLRH